MNKKVLFSLMLGGFVSLSLDAPSFAQNTVVPTEPVMTNSDMAADSTAKPKKAHRHHKGGKGTKKHRRAHKKLETEKQTNVSDNQVNGVTN